MRRIQLSCLVEIEYTPQRVDLVYFSQESLLAYIQQRLKGHLNFGFPQRPVRFIHGTGRPSTHDFTIYSISLHLAAQLRCLVDLRSPIHPSTRTTSDSTWWLV